LLDIFEATGSSHIYLPRIRKPSFIAEEIDSYSEGSIFQKNFKNRATIREKITVNTTVNISEALFENLKYPFKTSTDFIAG
jgi:hypothetical protein